MRTCETQLSHDMYRSRETNLERARNDAVHDSGESTCSGRMSFETDSGLFDSLRKTTDPKLKPSGKEIKITSERTCFNAKVLPWNVLAACLIETLPPSTPSRKLLPFWYLIGTSGNCRDQQRIQLFKLLSFSSEKIKNFYSRQESTAISWHLESKFANVN